MELKKIKTPLSREDARKLHYGDTVLLSGVIYTARDAAHARLTEELKKKTPLPFDIKNAVIYYTGPSPVKPGRVIGSTGPTTSSRMDVFTPVLIKAGLTGMIGKGTRSTDVIASMREFGAVYFGAIGGAGALLASCVESSEVIAYEDLGTEAIHKLTVKEMPLTVAIDSEGGDLYVQGNADYLLRRLYSK